MLKKQTKLLPASEEAVKEAAELLRNGGLVAFPTETVYGLGANALDAQAVQGIFLAKGRPANNPLIVHVPDADAAKDLVMKWPPQAQQLVDAFWPGPLTLVLPRNERIPDAVTGGGATVGIRMPAHPVALALLRAVRLPIAAPSANRSNHVSPTSAAHVWDDLAGRIDLILDGGATPGGIESTVLSLAEDPPRLLRPGLLSPEAIQAVIGPIQISELHHSSANDALPSPGMLPRHYAPTVPLELSENAADRVYALAAAGERVGWLRLGDALPLPKELQAHVTLVPMPANAADYARQLYAALRLLEASGVTRIVVDKPPSGAEWLAIQDRLRRAAT